MLNTDSIYNTILHARFHRCKRRHSTSLCAHTSQTLTVMSLLQLQNNNDYARIHTAHSPLSLIWHTCTQTRSKPTNGQLWVAVKPITLYTAYTVYTVYTVYHNTVSSSCHITTVSLREALSLNLTCFWGMTGWERGPKLFTCVCDSCRGPRVSSWLCFHCFSNLLFLSWI